MRLTRGCGYALRALEHLAARRDGRPATARDIAEARRAPRRFLLRPLKALVSAGLLRSAGERVGHALSRCYGFGGFDTAASASARSVPSASAWKGESFPLFASCQRRAFS